MATAQPPAPAPPPVLAPALRLHGLTKHFGERSAVDRLSLDVAPGELFGFLGPNGAGKTTTIKMLVGLLLPTSGTAEVCGRDVVRDAEAAKLLTGYVPDQPALYDRLTGREMLALAGDLYRVPRQVRRARLEPLLDAFGLAEQGSDLVQSYSRGMRQKLALCAALLHDPRLLLLDEPTVGLDPAGARQLKDVLRRLCAEGRSVFLSTHVLEIAERLCDRVGVIARGRLVAVGTPAELRAAAGEPTLEAAFLRLTGESAESAALPVLRALES